jgi:SOS-response transcriptional repressor LexA
MPGNMHNACYGVKAKCISVCDRITPMGQIEDIEPSERLRQARIAAGFKTAKQATDRFNWNYVTYQQHEKGTRGLQRAATKYAKKLGVSPAWLLTGEGSGPGSSGSPNYIPLISWINAGKMAADEAPSEAIDTVVAANLDPNGQWIALRVQGDSMDRISPPGSVIFVNRNDRDLVPGGFYVVANELHEATYKRWRPDPSRFEPYSNNPEHAPIIPNGEITVIGRVRQTMLQM